MYGLCVKFCIVTTLLRGEIPHSLFPAGQNNRHAGETPVSLKSYLTTTPIVVNTKKIQWSFCTITSQADKTGVLMGLSRGGY